MKALAYVLTKKKKKKARNMIVIQDMVIVNCHPVDFYLHSGVLKRHEFLIIKIK